MKILVRNAALVAAASALGFASSAQAATPGQFPEVQTNGSSLPFVPRSIDSRQTTVVVLLRGDPVAIVQKNVGRALTRAEKDTIIAALEADHDAVMPEIRRHGGQIVGAFHSALNGIKVKIGRNQLAALRSIPGVVDVKPVGIYEQSNAVSVPFIGAPQAWQLPQRFQGQGVKIAIVDTGIDYTHANFGGPGTVAVFQAAKATSTAPADPALFGPGAPKVKGGTDLVGDGYNAGAAAGSPALTPHPDPNPLDCGGHGSHVAGTAAGYGVKANGSTFTGPYNAAAYTPNAFKVGPGVAPMADLYAVRVFGCSGSTDVVSEAIDWAVNNGMNVISMSLGADFGATNNAETLAIANATAAGILVVAASGNAGPIPYITSAPAAIDGVISVAATDSSTGFPAANLALTGVANPILVQDSNGAAFGNGTSYPVVVLRNANGTVSLGCTEAEYDKTRNGGIDIGGKLVVTLRGTCARVFRAGAGQHYGAAAVAMINSSPGYPPFEGPIPGGDPATNPFEAVTIPFFGVQSSDAAKLTSPAPATAVATNAFFVNPGFEMAASFSSGGPRFGDSFLRPGITAPGVATVSTAIGTGNGAATMSGTSMATPHVAGVAALVKQANPHWMLDDLRAAVVQTAAPSKMLDYSTRLEGSGLVQALAAVNTQAVVRTPNDSLSFGFSDLLNDFSATRQVTIHNDGVKAVKFNISVTPAAGSASATVLAPASVIVNAKSDAVFPVTLNVAATSVGGTHAANGNCCLFQDVAGYIQLTPSTTRLNNGVALTVPYYLVAHTRSNLSTNATTLASLPAGSNNLIVSNPGGALAGEPDFYTLGQVAPTPQGVTYADTRAIGVQAIPTTTAGAPDSFLVFAINTFGRFSNSAGFLEWDITIDTTGTGTPNYVLVGFNGSAFSSSASAQNKLTAALIRLSDGAITALRLADVATDNSTVLLAVKASEMGLSVANPRFTYFEQHFGPDGTSAAMPGAAAKFNAFAPALTVTGGGPIAPNGSAAATVSIDAAESLNTPALGLMIVAPDNSAGPSQARLVPAN